MCTVRYDCCCCVCVINELVCVINGLVCVQVHRLVHLLPPTNQKMLGILLNHLHRVVDKCDKVGPRHILIVLHSHIPFPLSFILKREPFLLGALLGTKMFLFCDFVVPYLGTYLICTV